MDLTLSDAIKIFQINERGRQGYIRAKYMDDLKYIINIPIINSF